MAEGDAESGGDQDGPERVRKKMPHDHAQVSRTDRLGRERERLAAEPEKFAAHQSRHASPAGEADHGHDVEHVVLRFEEADRHEDEEQRREAIHDLDEPGDRDVGPAAVITGPGRQARTPMVSAMPWETKPMESEVRAPWSIRAAMSRPVESVPQRCFHEGGAKASGVLSMGE